VRSLLAAAALAAAAWVPAAAQPAADGRLALELGRLEPQDAACRTYVVMENRTATDFGTLRLDVFLFGRGREILGRVAVASRRVRPEQTRVLVFDVPGVDCGRVGALLLNGVLVCQEQGGRMRDDCGDLIDVRSRVDGVRMLF
jgi:hypothetical protein